MRSQTAIIMPLASTVELNESSLLQPSQTMDGNVSKYDKKDAIGSMLTG